MGRAQARSFVPGSILEASTESKAGDPLLYLILGWKPTYTVLLSNSTARRRPKAVVCSALASRYRWAWRKSLKEGLMHGHHITKWYGCIGCLLLYIIVWFPQLQCLQSPWKAGKNQCLTTYKVGRNGNLIWVTGNPALVVSPISLIDHKKDPYLGWSSRDSRLGGDHDRSSSWLSEEGHSALHQTAQV